MTRALVIAVLVSLASALAPSCAEPGTPLAITYLAGWDADGASDSGDGTWTTTTDLGFHVHVLAATMTTYAVTLVPCADTTTSARAERVRHLVGPLVAHAGHLDHADASMIEPDLTERLAPAEPVVVGTTRLPRAASYCRAHQLIGGRVDLTTETPRRLPSLSLALEVSSATGELVRSMDLATTVATGTLADLPPEPADTRAVEVRWLRPLGRLFDGIAWDDASLGTTDVAQAVLLTIAQRSRVEASFAPDAPSTATP